MNSRRNNKQKEEETNHFAKRASRAVVTLFIYVNQGLDIKSSCI